MKIRNLLTAGVLVITGSFLTYCQTDSEGFKTAESGMKYKIVETNGSAPQIKEGDIMRMTMKYYIHDSILFDSQKVPQAIQFPCIKSTFQGDFYEGLSMLHQGDSAIIKCNADSTFMKMFRARTLPKFVKPNDVVKFEVRILEVSSEADFKAKKAAEQKQLSDKGDQLLKDFLLKENITVQPTASGLYYVETLKGKGPMPVAGEKISVHYTGTLTDGTKFDSSFDRGKPLEFVVGKGQVIKGWDEALMMTAKGGKAKIVIPWNLAYGERGVGTIPAYSPLVFEIELVDILK